MALEDQVQPETKRAAEQEEKLNDFLIDLLSIGTLKVYTYLLIP